MTINAAAVRNALAQIGDGLADLVRGGGGRLVVPGGLDEAADGHHPAGVEEQRREHPLGDRSAEPDPGASRADFERAEDREVHVCGAMIAHGCLTGFAPALDGRP